MDYVHLDGCCCPDCLGLPQDSTSDDDTPIAPGADGATKPIYSLEQVIHALQTSDGSFASSAWATDVVTFSIGTGPLSPGQWHYESEYAGYVAMTPGMEAAAAEAFALWEEIIDLDLVEVENSAAANITFNYSSNTGNGTYAERTTSAASPGNGAQNTITDSDLWFADNWWTHDEESDLYYGGYGFFTYLHEIGHALGLNHPGGYNVSATYGSDATHFQDTRAYTVMSYFNAELNGSGSDHFGTGGRSYGSTPLLHDILALQSVYGANMMTRATSTTYGFNATADRDVFDFTINLNPVVAIWDAGGVDKIDVSGWGTDQVVDLRQGAFSSVGHLTDNLAIAYGVDIEIADTGGGNDRLIGNALDNVLTGNGGDDTLEGGAGADILFGGAGADVLDGGAGSDWVRFAGSAAGVDANLNSGTGAGGDATGDTYLGVEHLSGSAHGDVLTGDHVTSNRLFGLDGDDVIHGGGGHDFLLGGGGDDTVYGGTGRDVIRGNEGADWLDGGAQDDWVQFHDAGDGVALDLGLGAGTAGDAAGDTYVSIENVRGSNFADIITGSAARNIILGQSGDDLIDGAGGNDVLYGEAGDDTLIGGDQQDTFYGGAGADLIDGRGGNDWVRYSDAASGVAVSLLAGTGTAGDAAGDVLRDVEWLWGSEFDDVLAGDDGVNMIRGGAGDDTIAGHGGNDILQGYAGADVFVFAAGDGLDRINGFEIGADLIRLDGIVGFADLAIFDFRGDAAIGYDPGDTILLSGVDAALVSEGWFLFA